MELLDSLCLRLPFWPYARGAVFFLLAVPDFGGASYVYKNFIKPYTKQNSEVDGTSLIPKGKCSMLFEEDELFYDASREVEDEPDKIWERITSYEVKIRDIFFY